jgi:hypothetical protein
MRTIAWYVWMVEIAIRNLLGIKTMCANCKRWKGLQRGGCELIPSAQWWSNCVYFVRR